MSFLSRTAIAAAICAGVVTTAQAQTRYPSTDSFYDVVEGRSVYVDRAPRTSAPVPSSESDTVMGLRVPR